MSFNEGLPLRNACGSELNSEDGDEVYLEVIVLVNLIIFALMRYTLC